MDFAPGFRTMDAVRSTRTLICLLFPALVRPAGASEEPVSYGGTVRSILAKVSKAKETLATHH